MIMLLCLAKNVTNGIFMGITSSIKFWVIFASCIVKIANEIKLFPFFFILQMWLLRAHAEICLTIKNTWSVNMPLIWRSEI